MSCPFSTGVRGITEPRAWRPTGPVVRTEAPAGGPVWVVTDGPLARDVLADPRIVKDTGLAPAGWTEAGGLEPPTAQQAALTSLDGPPHAALRHAHGPLFTGRRMRARAGRMRELARAGLASAGPDEVDLGESFTPRFPLAVLCDLLGLPPERVDEAVGACRRMFDPSQGSQPVADLMDLGADAVRGDGLAAELRDRMPAGYSDRDLHYQLFALLFAGQITTDAALGFVIAYTLGGPLVDEPADALVREVLRRHPPAPFTLWRFAAEEVELAGERLPAGAPVLVDVAGLNAAGDDLTFGSGPHVCIGAQLAAAELAAVVDVLRADFPAARLAVPFAELQQVDAGVGGSRLTALPVVLR